MAQNISDPETLKGLAQPIRQRLYRLLAQIGPATGGTLARHLGTDPGQTSYHLRELAKRGFIEDAPELARDRRERWWRVVPGAVSWSRLDFGTPEGTAVADAALSQMVIDEFTRLRRYVQTRDRWSTAWQQAASGTDSFLRLTPAELAELTDELLAVLRRWAERTRNQPIEDDRRHVFHFMHAFPEEVDR
jgi:DNA-binding transcriptional ArsR family regulator